LAVECGLYVRKLAVHIGPEDNVARGVGTNRPAEQSRQRKRDRVPHGTDSAEQLLRSASPHLRKRFSGVSLLLVMDMWRGEKPTDSTDHRSQRPKNHHRRTAARRE